MIVRILGEGQFELSEQEASVLGELDRTLIDAMGTGDTASFQSALAASLDEVRRAGTAVPADHLGTSDLVLPHADASMEEVHILFADEGLLES
ncbi:MAG: hypothetical protein M3066_18880 [Actinomycetota bacterium]|nr:hypothetical protein [Actinomycetota bacterium]